MLRIGTLADGKYRILAVLGKGGLSTVYLVREKNERRLWALKEIRRKDGTDGMIAERAAAAERVVLGALHHAQLPAGHAFFETADAWFIVMEYIEGVTLADRVRTQGPQPEGAVLEWAGQICTVLSFLHAQSPPVIYRDLKPANLMLRPDGTIILIDFGTAGQPGSTDPADACLGTRGYAAPEQYDAGHVDERCDIYAFGATLYFLLTGQQPAAFPAGRLSVRAACPAVSTETEELVAACTAPDPSSRPPDFASVRALLDRCGRASDVRRRQKHRYRRVLAASLAAGVICFGSLGMITAQGTAVHSGYAQHLSEAAGAAGRQEKIALLEEAVALEPSREEAYLALLELYVCGDGEEEPDFSTEEAAALLALLGSRGEETQTNEAALRSNAEGFCAFSFAAALAYYCYFDGGSSTGKLLSAAWFSEADVGEEPAAQFAAVSEAYAAVFSDTGSAAEWESYWTSLDALVRADLSGLPRLQDAAAVYADAAAEVRENVVSFKRSGVTAQQMQALLSVLCRKAEEELPDLPDAAAEILQEAEAAREAVETAFSGQDAADLTEAGAQ